MHTQLYTGTHANADTHLLPVHVHTLIHAYTAGAVEDTATSPQSTRMTTRSRFAQTPPKQPSAFITKRQGFVNGLMSTAASLRNVLGALTYSASTDMPAGRDPDMPAAIDDDETLAATHDSDMPTAAEKSGNLHSAIYLDRSSSEESSKLKPAAKKAAACKSPAQKLPGSAPPKLVQTRQQYNMLTPMHARQQQQQPHTLQAAHRAQDVQTGQESDALTIKHAQQQQQQPGTLLASNRQLANAQDVQTEPCSDASSDAWSEMNLLQQQLTQQPLHGEQAIAQNVVPSEVQQHLPAVEDNDTAGQGYGDTVVGHRIELLRLGDVQTIRGTVTSHDSSSGRHTVKYDNGVHLDWVDRPTVAVCGDGMHLGCQGF